MGCLWQILNMTMRLFYNIAFPKTHEKGVISAFRNCIKSPWNALRHKAPLKSLFWYCRLAKHHSMEIHVTACMYGILRPDYLHGHCHQAGCLWVWVCQMKQSVSSTVRLLQESPGGRGSCPASPDQLYLQLPRMRSGNWKERLTFCNCCVIKVHIAYNFLKGHPELFRFST